MKNNTIWRTERKDDSMFEPGMERCNQKGEFINDWSSSYHSKLFFIINWVFGLNSHTEILTPPMWCYLEVRHWGGSRVIRLKFFWMGFTVSPKKSYLVLPFYSLPCENRERRWLSTKKQLVLMPGPLILEFPASRIMRGKYFLFKLLSLWYIFYCSPHWPKQFPTEGSSLPNTGLYLSYP